VLLVKETPLKQDGFIAKIILQLEEALELLRINQILELGELQILLLKEILDQEIHHQELILVVQETIGLIQIVEEIHLAEVVLQIEVQDHPLLEALTQIEVHLIEVHLIEVHLGKEIKILRKI
jgi:hypothetical protein